MVSIVVCSANNELFNQLSASIEETIGLDYEIIRIDNTGVNRVGIAEAYNTGASKARFPYLCFVHEDVIFVSEGWGDIAINHVESNDNIGALGLAGSIYKTKSVSSWWQPELDGIEPKRVNIIQHYKFIDKDPEHIVINPLNDSVSNVASLDGVFIFVQHCIWNKVKFDALLLNGFHGYDLDFTLRVGLNRRNIVVYDILIRHFSEGTNMKDWFFHNLKIHNKLNHILPSCCSGVNNVIIQKAELAYLRRNIELIESYSLGIFEKLHVLKYLMQSINILGIASIDYHLLKRIIKIISQYKKV